MSPHHSSISSGHRRRARHHRNRSEVRIAIPSPSTTKLNYRSDSDLPDDASTLASPILPQTTTKKIGGSDKKNNDVHKEKGRQQNRRGPPVRRSFLHQLDRFLTELQGTVCAPIHFHKIVNLSFLIFIVIAVCSFKSLSLSIIFHAGTDDHLRKNTFLTGNFAPVSKEHVSLPVEVVEGSIPMNLNGAFCRNGPNPIRDVQKKRYHWFDGREY